MTIISLCKISNDPDEATVDYSFEPKTWYHALDHYVKFLRACGYDLKNNSVGINTNTCIFQDDAELNNITTFKGEFV